MKITNISENKAVSSSNYNKTNQVRFTGLKNPLTKCMFVFDLDGTFANGTCEELKKILQITKQRTAKLIYATGRSKKEVEKLQQKLSEKGITLPTPEYLVCNNGQFLYENIDGILVKNLKYEARLRAKSNFDSKKVLELMNELAHSDKYKFSPSQLQGLKRLENYQAIKKSDPKFYTSKISHYEWNASEFMSEYFVSSDVNLPKLKQDIQIELAKSGMKTKFIENPYPKQIMDMCGESILLQSNPIRRHSDGSMTALFLCPADKADGVKYLKNQLDISYNEILMAGNDDNDISMAKLAKKGAYFICLDNSSARLKQISTSLKKLYSSIFVAKNEGAKAILEGMSEIIEG